MAGPIHLLSSLSFLCSVHRGFADLSPFRALCRGFSDLGKSAPCAPCDTTLLRWSFCMNHQSHFSSPAPTSLSPVVCDLLFARVDIFAVDILSHLSRGLSVFSPASSSTYQHHCRPRFIWFSIAPGLSDQRPLLWRILHPLKLPSSVRKISPAL